MSKLGRVSYCVCDVNSARGIDGVDQLYGGNFQEWQKQMSAMFIAKGRLTQAYPSISHIDEDGTTCYYPTTLGDIQDMFSTIDDHLMRRVPESLELSIGRMFACLERLCEPFRLFDLPAELRVRVYESAVIFESPQQIHKRIKDGIPALAQTSRQLRQEVIPVYFAGNVFTSGLAYGEIYPETTCRATARIISSWQRNVLGAGAQHLRYFDWVHPAQRHAPDATGRLRRRYESTRLRLTFDNNRGLRIQTAQELNDDSRKMLEEIVTLAKEEWKGHELTGEAILSLLDIFCHRPGPNQGIMNWFDLRLRAKTTQQV